MFLMVFAHATSYIPSEYRTTRPSGLSDSVFFSKTNAPTVQL